MNRSFQLQSLKINSPFILAPLAGYTDLAFRLLCRRYGAALCYTEMISCHGLVYHKEKTLQMTRTVSEEKPVGVQLFGADPDIMGEAAALVSEMGFDLIDINMGCPVKKVVKKGAGAALMKHPSLAAAIIRSVCARTSLPVSIKIRTGWHHDTVNAPDFARMAQDNGISAVTVHGRTWNQGFSGEADWQTIGRVKKCIAIPVIGNGSINTYQEGLSRLEMTGCDGVMIGRSALGNPWVFTEKGTPESLAARMRGLSDHLLLIQAYANPDKMLPKIKNHAGRYFKNIRDGAGVRKKIYNAASFDRLLELVDYYIQ